MARMTREFSLVLVGSGILTTGYFAYPDEDVEARQNEQVQQQLAGNHGHAGSGGHRTYGHGFIWIHTGAWAARGGYGSRAPAMGGHISRGGFGGIGRGSVGG